MEGNEQADLQKKLKKMLSQTDLFWWSLAAFEKTFLGMKPGENNRRRKVRRPAQAALWLEITPLCDGSASVRVDSTEPFYLPPEPAALLAVLAADSGPSEDGLVSWKTTAEIRRILREKTGKKSFSKRALDQLVYRLRDLLAKHNLDRDMVETNRTKKSLRFALRRGKPPPPAATIR